MNFRICGGQIVFYWYTLTIFLQKTNKKIKTGNQHLSGLNCALEAQMAANKGEISLLISTELYTQVQMCAVHFKEHKELLHCDWIQTQDIKCVIFVEMMV